MNKHTPGAMRAAEKIVNVNRFLMTDCQSEEHILEFATIIDQETADERDRLREALKDARAKLGFPLGTQPEDFFSIDYRAVANTVKIIDTALAEPGDGETNQKGTTNEFIPPTTSSH